MRAERRLGELMAEQPKAQGISGRFTGGVPDTPPAEPPTLASQGIHPTEWRKGRNLYRPHSINKRSG